MIEQQARPFYHFPCGQAQSIAAIEGEQRLSYSQLAIQSAAFGQYSNQFTNLNRTLIFLKAHNNIATLVAYLAALQSQHIIMLLDPALSEEKLQALVHAYQPNLIIENQQITLLHNKSLNLAPNLALMLSTSGSTGSAKQVCLSASNLQANSESICAYLPVLPSDVTITTLPFFYSYGLSVINSHLLAGATILFNSHSVVSREFWQLFKQHQVSSFAGVPYSYEMLLRLRFERMELPSLRYFTQAGGKLAVDKVKQLAQYAKEQNKQFFMMYGQTEASARMAYVPSELIADKPHTIGRAIPKGTFSLQDDAGKTIIQTDQVGELVYSGPNIMLGYAEHVKDLAEFRPLTVLATGDLAYQDEDGDYVICGRTKRIVKLFGERVNLDEVEDLIAQQGYQCYCLGDDAKLQVAVLNHNNIKELKMWLSVQLQVNHHAIDVVNVATLPLTANGKKDYPALKTMLETHLD